MHRTEQLCFFESAVPKKSIPYSQAALTEAMSQRDFEKAKVAIEAGADINIPHSSSGDTYLHDFSRGWNLANVRSVLEFGCSINQKNKFGWTPFMTSCAFGKRAEILDLLLAHGADYSILSNDKQNALTLASRFGNADAVQRLIQLGFKINEIDRFGMTPLLKAAENSKWDVVELLLENGADPNLTGRKDKYNALSLAHGRADLYVVYLMKKSGAIIQDVFEFKQQTFNVPLVNNARKLVPIFMPPPVKMSKQEANESLLSSSESGNLEDVKEAVANGAKIESKNSEPGRLRATALMTACYGGHFDIAKFLIEKGANVNALATDNSTALIWSCSEGYYEVAKLLIEHDADINAFNLEDESPITTAIEYSRVDIVKLLLESGVTINNKLENGDTILIHAIKSRNNDIVKLVLDHDLNINERDQQGWNALMHSIAQNNDTLKELLIYKGAELTEDQINVCENKITKNNRFFSAVNAGNIELVSEFINLAIDINSGDENSKWRDTALIIATKNNNYEMVEYLISKGADVNSHDDLNRNPCAYARNYSILELLLANNANIDTVDYLNSTPIVYAVQEGEVESVKLLIKAGANIKIESGIFKGSKCSVLTDGNVTSSHSMAGSTLIEDAIFSRQPNMVELLLKAGVCFSQKDIFNAALHCCPTILKMFKDVSESFDINMRDESGRNILEIFFSHGSRIVKNISIQDQRALIDFFLQSGGICPDIPLLESIISCRLTDAASYYIELIGLDKIPYRLIKQLKIQNEYQETIQHIQSSAYVCTSEYIVMKWPLFFEHLLRNAYRVLGVSGPILLNQLKSWRLISVEGGAVSLKNNKESLDKPLLEVIDQLNLLLKDFYNADVHFHFILSDD